MLNFLLTKEKTFDFLSKIFSIITPRPIEMFSVEMFPKSCMCKKSRGAD